MVWSHDQEVVCLTPAVSLLDNYSGQVVPTCASLIKQCHLVLVIRWWCFAAGKVTADLAESNGSLPFVTNSYYV